MCLDLESSDDEAMQDDTERNVKQTETDEKTTAKKGILKNVKQNLKVLCIMVCL